jgi:hypothetical protein
MKTENWDKTLEKVAENYSENWEEITGLNFEDELPSSINKLDFFNGAKWHAEQMKNLTKIANKIIAIKKQIKEIDYQFFGKEKPENVQINYGILKIEKRKLQKKLLKILSNEK